MAIGDIIKETDKYIVIETTHWRDSNKFWTRKEQKFRCVGGPYDGEFRAEAQLGPYGRAYNRYNSAGATMYNAIYIWEGREKW